jgi:hypothetical protein
MLSPADRSFLVAALPLVLFGGRSTQKPVARVCTARQGEISHRPLNGLFEHSYYLAAQELFAK